MFSYEKLQDDTIESFRSSVPTAKMRTGDFSELLANGVQIYDPNTARLVNGVVVRDPFPGNIIPNGRINPVARNVLGYFPAPNQAPAADFSQNFFVEQPWTYTYNFQMVRIDHEWTQDHRTYGRFIRNFRREERFNFAGEVQGVEITRGATDRFNFNYALGHTAVLSPSTVFDLKGSWLRFNDDLFPLYTIDPASLGFSASTAAFFDDYQQLPLFSIESGTATAAGRVARLGAQQSGFNSGRSQPFYNVQIAPTLTKTAGSHTFKIGYDWRQLRQAETNLGWKAGAFGFDGTLYPRDKRGHESVRPGHCRVHARDSHDELDLRNAEQLRRARQQPRRVRARRLARVRSADAESRRALRPRAGTRRRWTTATSAGSISRRRILSRRRRARISPRTRPRGCRSRLGVQRPRRVYVSGGGQGSAWKADRNNFQPRAGFTYKLSERSVLRGGVGLFIAPFQIQGVPGITTGLNQIGYRAARRFRSPSDNGLTFQANLTNPIPSGQLLTPVGSGQGLTTNLGNAPATSRWPIALTEDWRYSFGIERQFPGDFLVEISYLGQRGRHLPILETVNYVPQQFRTQSPLRDAAAETFLSQVVSNPFVGLTPDSACEQRRDNRAPPVAVSASAIRSERHLHRQRHVLHGDGQRIERLSRDDLPRGQAVHERVHADELVHLVAHARARDAVEPMGRARTARGGGRPAASHHVRVGRRVPVGRDADGGGTGLPASMRFSADGSSARSSNGRSVSRSSSTTTRIRPGVRRS